MLGTDAPPDVISPFFNRLVQSIRSQDASQVQNLFQFYLPAPIPREIQAFILTIRYVGSLFDITDIRNHWI
jgi:hypothetical protein